MNKPVVYTIFIVAVVALGVLSGISNLPGAWYQSLAKPVFNPPNWIFAPVWTLLYGLIGIAGAATFIEARRSGRMLVWWVQMLLNLLWSPAFFSLQQPALALAIILGMLISIAAFTFLSWRPNRPAALLFLPYLAWVGFATLLNLSIVILN